MKMNPKTTRLIKRICREYLAPPAELTVSQWAERYRVLDGSSALPGRWNNGVTPYLMGIMDEFCNPHTRKIVFVKPTQVGGTEALLNILGWCVAQDPAPTMIVYPIDELAKSASENRITPMIEKSESLKRLYVSRKSKVVEKKFKGATLYLRSANSPQQLASIAVKHLLLDESDKFPGATKKEASPYKLAEERTKTYPFTKKIYDNCTPTLESGHIWQEKESADVERHYFVPCPHCGEELELELKYIKWPSGEGMTVSERAEQACYFCAHCGEAIEDKYKPLMLRQGKWKDVHRRIGAHQEPRKVAFWLNALYSPFLTWQDIAKEFMESKEDPELFQNFVNSWLAEPWLDKLTAVDENVLLNRQAVAQEFIVPEWAVLLTGGIDVQKNSVYWTIRAWGPYMTSQNIAHGQAFSLEEAEQVMNLEYLKESGEVLMVELCGVDSGDQTDMVYEFCMKNSDWAIPVKGSSHDMPGYFRISTINKTGSAATGQRLVNVDTGKYKDIIAARMKRENGRGSWMVYRGCDMDYAEQVTSEQKVVERRGGREYSRWVSKKSRGDNHYLDAEVYAFAAADLCHVRNLHLNPAEPTKEQEPPVDDGDNWLNIGGNWLNGGG